MHVIHFTGCCGMFVESFVIAHDITLNLVKLSNGLIFPTVILGWVVKYLEEALTLWIAVLIALYFLLSVGCVNSYPLFLLIKFYFYWMQEQFNKVLVDKCNQKIDESSINQNE